jgi:hypothetical protein
VSVVKEYLICIEGRGLIPLFSGRNLIIKTELRPGDLKAVFSFYPKHVEFWQFPAAYQSDAWCKLSYEYLTAVRKHIPGSEITVHKHDIDLKIKRKYMPIKLMRPHISEIAHLLLMVVESGRKIACGQQVDEPPGHRRSADVAAEIPSS